jgi:ATP/maltotriose-dependent transcriptional regulator MalT
VNGPLRVAIIGTTEDEAGSLRARISRSDGIVVDAVLTMADLANGVATPRADALMVTPAALESLRPPGRAGEDDVLIEHLTAREHDVLTLAADGLSNREIATALEISDHTVKFHLASIFGKLAVASRTEAVRRGLQLGLIDI